jgi:predicted TIM-barrel fold metal-dependent hydrolase
VIVDFHHHIVPPALADRHGIAPGKTQVLVEGGLPKFTLHERLFDVAAHLRDMDRAGIDVAVLTCNLGWDAPLDDCRLINDYLAEVQHCHPGRFVGLAHAPVLEQAGLREIQRAHRDLGLPGVAIASQLDGVPLDSPRLLPFYRTVAALDLPVFIHPAMLPRGYALVGEYDMARILGREVDLQLAVARLIAGRVLEEFPSLALVVAHLGGGIAAVKERLAAKAHRFGTLTRPFDESFDRLYFDMAGFEGGPVALAAALAGIRRDRLVFATDYPQDFTGATTRTGRDVQGIRDYAELVRRSGETDGSADLMLGATAARLLKLAS